MFIYCGIYLLTILTAHKNALTFLSNLFFWVNKFSKYLIQVNTIDCFWAYQTYPFHSRSLFVQGTPQ